MKHNEGGWEGLQEKAADCIQRLWDHLPRTSEVNDLTFVTPKSQGVSEDYTVGLLNWNTGVH